QCTDVDGAGHRVARNRPRFRCRCPRCVCRSIVRARNDTPADVDSHANGAGDQYRDANPNHYDHGHAHPYHEYTDGDADPKPDAPPHPHPPPPPAGHPTTARRGDESADGARHCIAVELPDLLCDEQPDDNRHPDLHVDADVYAHELCDGNDDDVVDPDSNAYD